MQGGKREDLIPLLAVFQELALADRLTLPAQSQGRATRCLRSGHAGWARLLD